MLNFLKTLIFNIYTVFKSKEFSNMMIIVFVMYYFLLLKIYCFFVILILVFDFFVRREIIFLRSCGIYPKENEATEEDVYRLIKLGKVTLAMRCYRSIHNVSLKEAKEIVTLMKNRI